MSIELSMCVSSILVSPESGSRTVDLYVIDWEYTQINHRTFDLGQMIADLLERHHFSGSLLALQTMQGFLKGYGKMNEDMAFRTAIHAGVHMIGWYTRRNPNAPLPAPMDVATSFMRMAVEFIVNGWEEGRGWFVGTKLGCLFEQVDL
jgi:hypothetical protein